MAPTITPQTRQRINMLPGLIDKVQTLENRTDSQELEIKALQKFLFTGDIANNEPSLSERIRSIENLLQGLSRLAWIVTTAIVGAASIFAWESLIK